MTEPDYQWAKVAKYTLILEGPDRYRLTRGTRHHYVRKINGRWMQTTKDGALAAKRLPPEDFKKIVEAIEGRQ